TAGWGRWAAGCRPLRNGPSPWRCLAYRTDYPRRWWQAFAGPSPIWSFSEPRVALRRSVSGSTPLRDAASSREGCLACGAAGPIYACCLRVLHHPDTCDRQTAGVSGKLIVSVSGIGERTLADVEAFCAQMDARKVPVSLLVAPRLSGDYRLDRDPHTVERLAARRAGGNAHVANRCDSAT